MTPRNERPRAKRARVGRKLGSAAAKSSPPKSRRRRTAPATTALRDEATGKLEKKFEEQVAGRGLVANGKAMFELFVSKSGSWTVLVSDPKGRSCIIASGEHWQQIPLVVGDPA